MRAVVQRVTKASVAVEKKEVATIGQGLLVLLGIHVDDTQIECDYLIKKLLHLRIFKDEEGKMNKSIQDVRGEVLLVSQFTLYANTQKGNRPSFIQAMHPEPAEKLFAAIVEKFRIEYSRVQVGIFGAEMQVCLCNDGPVTIIIETKSNS